MTVEQNTEIVKDGYEKFSSGDIPGLLEHFADDIRWTTPTVENAPFTGQRRGLEAVSEFFQLLNEAEEFTRFEPLEFIAQDDKVVVHGEFASTIKATGRSYETEWVHLFTLRDGKIINFLEFFDTAAANRAFQKASTA